MNPLAEAILGEDATEVYEQLRPFMEWDEFKELGAMLEFCPIHYCDLQICIDDQVHGEVLQSLDNPDLARDMERGK